MLLAAGHCRKDIDCYTMRQITSFVAAYSRRKAREDAKYVRLTRLAVISVLDGDAAAKVEEICQKMERVGNE